MDMTYEEYLDFLNHLFLEILIDFDYQDFVFENEIERL